MGASCPMTTLPRLDLVHTSPVVSTALRHALSAGPQAVHVTTSVHSWSDFQREWDFAGEVVVLDALLDDHVPLPLKVRALTRLGSQTVVLGPGRLTSAARRSGAEGAVAWIEPTAGLAATAEAIRQIALGSPPPDTRIDLADPPLAHLTDRELQVLALYVTARGHTPAHLGQVLSLRTETIRSHLERGRARYRAAGVLTNNRAALRRALVADGWALEQQVWIDAGRP